MMLKVLVLMLGLHISWMLILDISKAKNLYLCLMLILELFRSILMRINLLLKLLYLKRDVNLLILFKSHILCCFVKIRVTVLSLRHISITIRKQNKINIEKFSLSFTLIILTIYI